MRRAWIAVIVAVATTAAAQDKDAPKTLEFPTFGVAVTPPAGWRRIVETGPGHIARWAKIDPKGQALAVLVVEVSPKKGATLDAYAADLAKRMPGKIAKDPIDLGGDKGRSIEAGARGKMLAPFRALAVDHGGFFYVVSAF